MLRVICLISLLSSSILLTACGQSGALQLPSDPNYDHRAKYLLYRNKESKQVVQKDEKAEQPVESSSTPTQTTSP
ncbi:lipoprotein [Acinetobacter nosocomialis]|uniref:LPS translocon maturation chaperone LptM n=1 Tax=Acinetobacter nosocomialis TaxID=106654 RepID=UPI00374F137B